MIEVLHGQTVHSITPDWGKEFARHAVAAEALGVKIYIPSPYQPWQSGTNENTNGLLREYFRNIRILRNIRMSTSRKLCWR